jgi:hypothetical protein
MKPKAIVLGAGIWFVWSGKKNYTAYQEALRNMLKRTIPVAKEVKLYIFNMLNYTQCRSLIFPFLARSSTDHNEAVSHVAA